MSGMVIMTGTQEKKHKPKMGVRSGCSEPIFPPQEKSWGKDLLSSADILALERANAEWSWEVTSPAVIAYNFSNPIAISAQENDMDNGPTCLLACYHESKTDSECADAFHAMVIRKDGVPLGFMSFVGEKGNENPLRSQTLQRQQKRRYRLAGEGV